MNNNLTTIKSQSDQRSIGKPIIKLESDTLSVASALPFMAAMMIPRNFCTLVCKYCYCYYFLLARS